jgi:hypothetical protein
VVVLTGFFWFGKIYVPYSSIKLLFVEARFARSRAFPFWARCWKQEVEFLRRRLKELGADVP